MTGYILTISSYAARTSVKPLARLVHNDETIKDSVMLILRKSIFSKDVKIRIVAVFGYLELMNISLMMLTDSDHAGEGASSQMSSSLKNAPLVYEIMGTLYTHTFM